jgi:hypothetical protein
MENNLPPDKTEGARFHRKLVLRIGGGTEAASGVLLVNCQVGLGCTDGLVTNKKTGCSTSPQPRTQDHPYPIYHTPVSYPEPQISHAIHLRGGADTYPAKPIRNYPNRIRCFPRSLQLLKKLRFRRFLRAPWYGDR